MSQQEPSKRNKKSKNKTFAKPGSLSFLANKKRRLLTTNEIVQAIECEKGHLLKLIGVQQLSLEQPIEELHFEDQVQMNLSFLKQMTNLKNKVTYKLRNLLNVSMISNYISCIFL
ncbi:hypothetical protein H5410_045567 [Solanum commersonii]|uniref:Uncharacterized protein n=1 Tax=Solanum commersonii TaxID=4109 RepID=A0A9J5XBZ9_SOLCO|nr:hypothetical protein H5410_045567 [Solanum commersonii]